MSENDSSQNAVTAFLLVVAAGAATALGAAVVFFPSLVKLASRRVLAASLGFSAGVMTYVSFIEIFGKSVISFSQAGLTDNMAYIYATLSFFGGVLTMKILDLCVKLLVGDHHHHHHHHVEEVQDSQNQDENSQIECESEQAVPHCVGCSDDPVAELNEWHQRADEELGENQRTIACSENLNETASECGSTKDEDDFEEQKVDNSSGNEREGYLLNEEEKKVVVQTPDQAHHVHDEHKKLVRMGLNTAIAIGLHNFPEGLATFVAALHDPQVGAVLAVAIALHNIPEGLCVSLPIYYATGNRPKAFLWGCVSGASEPIAALLGWAVLANTFSMVAYAILFGLVSGMMVIISMKELLPTAHRYDAEDTVVTYSFIGGMMMIALSLVLFKV